MFKTIVVATDGSDHADKAAAVAGDLAAKYDAEITVLHVSLRRNAEATDLRRLIDVEKLPDNVREEFKRFEVMQNQRKTSPSTAVGASIPFPEDVMIGVSNAIVEKAKDIATQHGALNINSVITEGDPADVILDTAKDRDADLIVMGTRGLSNLGGLFVGSVSHKVSHLASCTCITVR